MAMTWLDETEVIEVFTWVCHRCGYFDASPHGTFRDADRAVKLHWDKHHD